MTDITHLIERHWDAIVVGTGMGGATAGYALAESGKRVLFCEAGLAVEGSSPMDGDYAERRADPSREQAETFRQAGRAIDSIRDESHGAPRVFTPFAGAGPGGSSALYGMALERFAPVDFEPRSQYADATDSNLPDAWPISYGELVPYYEAAERLYRVRSGAPGSTLSPSGSELSRFLERKGLHPYRLPMACEFVAGCIGCQGYRCARACKNDSARMCLAPALQRHGASLIDDCRVLRLVADANQITGLVCRRNAKEFTLTAEIVVLAAGALETPGLLLGSTDGSRPDGIANRSGQVGRNLMRHCIDLYAVAVDSRPAAEDCLKELAFNDFYAGPAGKLGSVQSFGRMPPVDVLVDDMQDELRDTHGALVAAAVGLAKPLLRPMLGRLFSRRVVLAAVMEDLPYAANRIEIRTAADGKIERSFRYRLHPHEITRVRRFRTLIGEALSPYRVTIIKQAENNRRLAHACGTCRFGDDPRTSVLDRDNRAHDVANLYVVDASFFPSSGGTNPSLTIAANALRVVDRILQRAPGVRRSAAIDREKEYAL